MLATSLVTLALLGQSPDVKSFRAAFALRHSETPTEKQDPGIIKAMDILIAKVRKDTSPATSPEDMAKMLRPYSQAIANEEVFSTSYPNLSAAISRSPGRVAVGVRMGAISRLRVFNTVTGKPIAVPKEFDWRYQYESLPQFFPGGKLIVDGPGIQDAGVRYGYRVSLLSPMSKGYEAVKQYQGVWVLDDEGNMHIGTSESRLKLWTLDEPKSFFTSSPTKLFTTMTTIDWSGLLPRVEKVERKDLELRAVDDWMANAMKAPKTDMEKTFQTAFGKERQMIDAWSTQVDGAQTGMKVRFEDVAFEFWIKPNGASYKVLSCTVVK